MKKQYRTDEQFLEIIETMLNGNWTQAGEMCIEYGFYANDLVKSAEDYIEYEDPQEVIAFYKDLVLLAEMRYKK
ncbi:hypothetical protein [Polynucleobacter sp.]|uniref:hypothetical protein n=1 Tax=Polynucleobacter sp. TaxID=2029855 RepID=UPI003F69B5BF